VAYGDDSTIPSGHPEGRFLTVAPRTPSPTFEPFTDVDDLRLAGKGKGKTLHKRQISEAIPSTERDERAVMKVDISKEGTRIGTRPRKPKSGSPHGLEGKMEIGKKGRHSAKLAPEPSHQIRKLHAGKDKAFSSLLNQLR